jgi:hypothetical protein
LGEEDILMDRLGLTLVMAVIAGVGFSHSAWGGNGIGPVAVVAGTLAIGTLCLVGGLVWAFVAWVFGWRLRDAITRGKVKEARRESQPTNQSDDPWGPRPR